MSRRMGGAQHVQVNDRHMTYLADRAHIFLGGQACQGTTGRPERIFVVRGGIKLHLVRPGQNE